MKTLALGLLCLVLGACARHPQPTQAAATSKWIPNSLVAGTSTEGSDLIGQIAPEWQASQWFNSAPLTLQSLRGEVVLVRWFMSPDCPFCSGTAPALRALHERYGKRGLRVIGMYHHKQDAPLNPEDVRGWAHRYGYEFPVAIDRDWLTLNRWWLNGHPNASYTSVSFLLDKAGVIRRIHLGGLIDVNSPEFEQIDADVQQLLRESSRPATLSAGPAPRAP